MQTVVGMILGAVLLALGVYAYDSTQTSNAANSQVAQTNHHRELGHRGQRLACVEVARPRRLGQNLVKIAVKLFLGRGLWPFATWLTWPFARQRLPSRIDPWSAHPARGICRQ